MACSRWTEPTASSELSTWISYFLTDKVAFLSVLAAQAYVEVEIMLHSFLISAQDIFWIWWQIKVKSKVVPFHAMKSYRGRRVIAPLIPYLGTRQRWMVNITTECFTIGEEHPYQFNGRLGAPQTLSGTFDGGENSLASAGIQTQILRPAA